MSCCTQEAYIVGDYPRVRATFRRRDTTELYDPSTLRIVVQSPDGLETEHLYPDSDAITRESEGVYSISVEATQSGTWVYRFVVAGSLQGAAEHEVHVHPSAMATP